MSRVPIRVRLTAVFAAAMVVVLAAAALFVYVQLRADLDETVDRELAARVEAVASLARQGDRGLGDAGPGVVGEPEEAFAQLLTVTGRVVASTGGVRGRAIGPAQVRAAAREAIVVERRVPGIEGTARIQARPAAGVGTERLVVVGQSLDDRDEALSGLIASFAVGGPVAVLLASLLGYGMATAALRPVEAMRRRAAAVSLSGDRERLPLPAARDEMRRLGETLNEMLDRLRRSFDRERRFVADASHELRTPIAVLKTELEALLRRGGHSPDVREALLAAVEEADHLAQLAEDLLVLARASEGRLPVRREPLDVRTVLDGVRDRFSDRAGEQQRRIEVDAPTRVVVVADPLRLRQALGNLVDNALRHGAGDVMLTARSAAGAVEIDVADQGPGFSAGLADRAFERFARGDDARSRGGAGLGLAIVRAIAEAHGGDANIVHAPRGADVRLRLPAGGADDDRVRSQAQLSGRPQHAERMVGRSEGGTP